MSNSRTLEGEKFSFEPTVKILECQFTCDAVAYMFEEQDRWLAEFIFKNFGQSGNDAMQRLYQRLRMISVYESK